MLKLICLFCAIGLTDIATALRRSVSVRRVEFPGCDAAAGGRGASERVATLWRDLHERYVLMIFVCFGLFTN